MKSYILTFIFALISIVGISQIAVEYNPYEWVCGENYINWDSPEADNYEFMGDYECIANASYYVDTIEIMPGQNWSNISIEADELHFYHPDNSAQFRGTFSYHYWGGDAEPPNDLKAMPGLSIIDLNASSEEDSVVYYINRYQFASHFDENELNLSNNSDLPQLNLSEGLYEIRIIHKENDNIGFVPDNVPTQDLFWSCGFEATHVTNGFDMAPNFYGPFYTEGPEVVISEEGLNYEVSTSFFTWNEDEFNVCDTIGFILSPPCNDNLTYIWKRDLANGAGNYEPISDSYINGCSLHIPDTSVHASEGPYYYKVEAVEINDEDTIVWMENEITVYIHNNPSFEYYTIVGDTPDEVNEGCDLYFEVGIDTVEADTYYEWTVSEDTEFLNIFNHPDF